MRVKVNGVWIYFEVVGCRLRPDGPRMRDVPTLVVLHGGPGMDLTLSFEEIAEFADVCQVVFIDHRGHGRSGGWDDPRTQTLAQWGDDVFGFCEALDIQRPFVLGTSFGGMVAQSYAIRHPEHPQGLILNTTSSRVVLEEIFETFRRVEGSFCEEIARKTLPNPTHENMALYFEHCLPKYVSVDRGPDKQSRIILHQDLLLRYVAGEGRTFDFTPHLSRLQCPTLVLAGRDDPITPWQRSQAIAEAIGPLARLHILEGARHNVITERPALAPRLVRDFIAEVSASDHVGGQQKAS